MPKQKEQWKALEGLMPKEEKQHEPCPWCRGSKLEVERVLDCFDDHSSVVCQRCGARGPTVDHLDLDRNCNMSVGDIEYACYEAWNERRVK